MTNLDIIIANEIAQMYSEREYDWANENAKAMFDEVDDEND